MCFFLSFCVFDGFSRFFLTHRVKIYHCVKKRNKFHQFRWKNGEKQTIHRKIESRPLDPWFGKTLNFSQLSLNFSKQFLYLQLPEQRDFRNQPQHDRSHNKGTRAQNSPWTFQPFEIIPRSESSQFIHTTNANGDVCGTIDEPQHVTVEKTFLT